MIYRALFLSLGSLLLMIPASAQDYAIPTPVVEQYERILSFDSDITIEEDGALLVTEEITVYANQNNIQRGIFRDFPTIYEHPSFSGFRSTTTFDVVEILRDGKPEPYHMDNIEYGKRVYIGDEDVFLVPGEYTYDITYRTKRQIAYSDEEDTLWWNVTGNGWFFPIESASATVRVPEGVAFDDLAFDAYTGDLGATEQNVDYYRLDDGSLHIATTVQLQSYEGFTIGVGLPPGHIGQPESVLFGIARDNIDSILFLLVVLYYFIAWWNKGRDPKKGTIVPQYEPPNGVSPAEVRYLQKMHLDKRGFAAAVINMGVKGFLTIEKNKKEYTLRKTGKNERLLSDDERAIAHSMLKKKDSITLGKKYSPNVNSAVTKWEDILVKKHLHKHFHHNSVYILPGAAITLLIMAIPWWLYATISGFQIFLFLIAIVINVIFGFLLYAPTLTGRKLMDEIEGFKWFLSVTEKERLEFAHPPEKTPELFEKFLPYALALGVENKWSEQFADVFKNMEEAQMNTALSWYAGASLMDFASGSFAHDIGSGLSSTIAKTSVAPSSGSSGGSSFGGFSGGGGGGGGGGGW